MRARYYIKSQPTIKAHSMDLCTHVRPPLIPEAVQHAYTNARISLHLFFDVRLYECVHTCRSSDTVCEWHPTHSYHTVS